MRRPETIPRSSLTRQSPAEPVAQQFQYSGSPPGYDTSYTTNPATRPRRESSAQDPVDTASLNRGLADLSLGNPRTSTHLQTEQRAGQVTQGNASAQQRSQQREAPAPYRPEPVQASIFDSAGRRVVDAFDQGNFVRTRYSTGPADRITDPALFEGGVRAYRMLINTQNEGDTEEITERLFTTFKVRDQPRRFFTRGKVFLVLWVEPAGESRTMVTDQARGTTTGRYGEAVYSKVRRFVVIREGANYCSALPIATYGRQGVGKHGVVKSEHAIIYTGRTPPEPMEAERPKRAEQGMRPEAIRIDPDNPEDKLDPRSRIDFGKVHTIQHNIKVRNYGQVHPRSMSALLHQFGNIFGASAQPVAQPAPATSTGARSSSSRHRTDSHAAAAAAARRESISSGHMSQPPRSTTSASSRGRRHGTAQSRVSETIESDDEEEEADDDHEDEADDHREDETARRRQERERQDVMAAIDRLQRAGRSREDAVAIVRARLAQGTQRSRSGRGNSDQDDSDGDD